MSVFLVNPKNKLYPARIMALILTAAKPLGAQKSEAGSGTSCASASSYDTAQPRAEMPGERITQHLFARAVRLFGVVRFAPAGGSAQKLPIGRPLAGALKAGRVHETLQVVHWMRIDAFPVAAQSLDHAA